MKNLFLSLLAIGLLVGMSSTVLADELVSVKAGYQVLAPSGSFAGSDGGAGTKIDLKDDIDFDDSEDVTAEIAFHLGDSRLTFSYLPLDLSGGGTLDKEITFGDQIFNVNDVVDSDIAIDIYEVAYTYYLLNFDDLPSRFQLGIEAAVKYADADASMSNTTAGTEAVSGSAPIPTIGLRSRVALGDFIGVAGRVGYMEYDGNSFLDADVQVEFSPLPMVGIYGGYRVIELDIDESDLFVDATFEGPFAGAFVRF
ncbi:MAG TPA: hypothetical protein VJ974_00940 [Geopsychrobacteraceae bacterium]|nr:hypothetical protein [Geopsychrobacteraceae bacterium]